jgi:hypothetical protein
MSVTENTIDELPESTHTNFRTHRDFITHVDGSSLTGEQYVNAFIRTRSSGSARHRLADLSAIECEGGRQWQDAAGRTVYLERPIPAMYSSRLSRPYEQFLEWIELQRR